MADFGDPISDKQKVNFGIYSNDYHVDLIYKPNPLDFKESKHTTDSNSLELSSLHKEKMPKIRDRLLPLLSECQYCAEPVNFTSLLVLSSFEN